jgi:hypothetical protein
MSLLPFSPLLMHFSCLGWNTETQRTECSAAYRSGSYLCRDCAQRYYPFGDNTCSPCPSGSYWNTFRGLFELLLGVVAAAILVFSALKVVVWYVGGTLVNSTQQLLSLGIWTVISLQSVSQVRTVLYVSLGF